MANIDIQAVSGEVGADINFATCAAGGDALAGDRLSFIIIDNADAAPKTITFTPFNSTVTDAVNGTLTRAPIVVTVPANQRRIMRGLGGLFLNATNRVAVTYSAVTSLRIAAVTVA